MTTEALSLQDEKYLSARLLERVCQRYGDKGVFLIGIYKYLREVDDKIDNSTLGKSEKVKYVTDQIEILQTSTIPENSEQLSHLPWMAVKEHEAKIRFHVSNLLSSIREDAIYQGLEPRNKREIRHYNWRTLNSAINLVGIVLNDKPIIETKEYMNLLNAWNNIGSLIDFDEDIANSQLKIPLDTEQVSGLNKICEKDEKQAFVLDLFNKKQFTLEIYRNLLGVIENSTSFFSLDMPTWQRILSFLYVTTRIPAKTVLKGTLSISRRNR